MKKQHIKMPKAFDATILAERQEDMIQRYLTDSLPYGSRTPVERHAFASFEEAADFLIQVGKEGRSLFKMPFKYCPGYWPVALTKPQADIDADIAAIREEVEQQYRAELEQDRQEQIALLIEQQESLFQRKESERLEAERQARLEQFRKDAEAVL